MSLLQPGMLAAVATGTLLTATVGHALADAPVQPPNVLFILADDLGWRDTGVYGSTFYETPNIDRLAQGGMRFTDACSASPLCSPTRASILTGQYPVRHGLTTASGHVAGKQAHEERTAGAPDVRGIGPTSLNYLDPKYQTLSKTMKGAGYATGFFGKWHLGHAPEFYPENHGFDLVRGGRHHPGPPGKNPARKFYPPWNCETLDSNVPPDTHIDDHLADQVIAYIKKQQSDGKPFFVCYWAYSVHSPFQSKPELIEKWKKKVDPNNPQHSPTMAAMIEVFDGNVGRLLDALKATGLDQNTIVIFTSDNGGNMYDTVDGTTPTNNAPLRNGKGNNYDGGVRVPLIVRWPGVTKAGSICDSVVSSVDHYPTILQMTGRPLQPADHKDGLSYVPALEGKPFDRGPTLCDFPHSVTATHNIPNTSLRLGDFKLYRFWYDNPMDQSHRYELYNLRADISESTDLAPTQPDQLKRMADLLDGYYRETSVLTYHPNKNYNRRTVGTWFATSDDGTIAASDETLVIHTTKPGFTIKNRHLPSVDANCELTFEACSPSSTPLTVGASDEKKGKTITLTPEWKRYRIRVGEIGLTRESFTLTLRDTGEIRVRNALIVTKDNTEMMRYRFY